MPSQTRRERARVERRDLIVRTARELAEAEGWDAVTTRRLAEHVDYSQPVLYGHFKNMDAIAARRGPGGVRGAGRRYSAKRAARDGLRGLARAYLGYAEEHPAVYEAMFVRRTDLVFGTAETPAASGTPSPNSWPASNPTRRGTRDADRGVLERPPRPGDPQPQELAAAHRITWQARADLLVELLQLFQWWMAGSLVPSRGPRWWRC